MTGGHHHAAGGLEVIGLEIDFLGAAQADVDHVTATGAQAGRQRFLQRRAGQAHVMAQDHRPLIQLRRQRHADAAGQVLVEFIRHTAANVVGLEGG